MPSSVSKTGETPVPAAPSKDAAPRAVPLVRQLLARREVWLSLSVLVVFLAAWEFLPGWFEIPLYIIPPASSVWFEFFNMIERDRLFHHAGITLFQTALGFSLGALLGMMIGYLLGMSPTTEIVLSPYILALQIAPKVAFAPLFIIWFGYTMTPKILVAVLIVFFPILINVLSAVRNVDPALINLARSFNASRWQIFWKIEFPSSMPALFSGLRIGATLAVIGVTVGEFVGGNTGLGFLLVAGEGQGNTPVVFVAIIMLTLIGILLYLAVVFAERRVLHYMPKRAGAAAANQGGP